MNKKLKVTFVPGAFDNFEGTQDELDSLVAEIQKMVESGELLERSEPIDLDYLEHEDPELYHILKEIPDNLDIENKERKRKLN